MPATTLAQLRAERDAAIDRVTTSVSGERSNIERLGDSAMTFAQKHPLTALAGAAGLGALAIYIIRAGHLGRSTRFARRLLLSPILGDVAGRVFSGMNGADALGE